jgi:hypothetical protein
LTAEITGNRGRDEKRERSSFSDAGEEYWKRDAKKIPRECNSSQGELTRRSL